MSPAIRIFYHTICFQREFHPWQEKIFFQKSFKKVFQKKPRNQLLYFLQLKDKLYYYEIEKSTIKKLLQMDFNLVLKYVIQHFVLKKI